MSIDLSHVRDDFPILSRSIHGKPLVYLDSAASAQKPVQVLDAMDDLYRNHYANVHRGAYALSEESTAAYEAARATAARFIRAGSSNEIAFVRGATSGLNAVAYGWGLNHLKAGDKILLTLMEHHANVVPWQLLTRYTGAELVYAPFTENYRLDVDALTRLLDDNVKVVALTAMSNVLGTIPPVAEIAALARERGALVVVDAAQLVPHAPVDVAALGADFIAFSGHKMLGPTGIGVLWGRMDRFEEMEPLEGGGEMIDDVQLESSTWAPIPHRFEAGTPPFVEAVGLAAAMDYLDAIGMETVAAHDEELTAYALSRLGEVAGLRIYGPSDTDQRGGVVSFTMEGIHPHDIATILDGDGIAIRAGHHCARPLARTIGVPSTARASFYVYNRPGDVDALIDGLHRAKEIFGVA
ncbi:MAG: SufS family cysteine desulfurase [Gammaproteobacteria bacterium]|nr:SufS family cysteine desulfurase [Gammaproteobacteria bacterium]